MNIHGFITLTLLDYPEHLAASIFLAAAICDALSVRMEILFSHRKMNLPFLKKKCLPF